MNSVGDFAIGLETDFHYFVDFGFELEQLQHHGRVLLRVDDNRAALVLDPLAQFVFKRVVALGVDAK